jgi:tripartite-type tricarboxylate transporter receptor subunit TctC
MNRFLPRLSLLAALALASAGALAQAWPERALKLVVPYTPGGQFDIVARMVAQRMGASLGQPVLVENRPGGGTIIGADYVAKSRNDGYTLLYAGANMFAIAPHLRKLPYQRADFQPISLVSDLPMGLVVRTADVPAADLKSFIAYVKAHPGKLDFGTSGEGGAQHLLCELVKDKAGIDMRHVGYKGTAQVIQDLLPGRVQAACDGLLAYIPHTKDGTLRILAVSSERRMEALPDIPTFAELGLPQATVASWGGVVAPAGVPAPVLDKLHDAVVAAASAPEVRSRIVADAAVPHTTTPAQFAAIIEADYEKWGSVIRKLNLHVQ